MGHGVGLNDDLPSGAKLPEWIERAFPNYGAEDFGPWDLDGPDDPESAGWGFLPDPSDDSESEAS
jgi:hypothetical protein